MSKFMACPCGSKRDYKDCCKLFHDRSTKPETAEKLMRSRYTAFVKNEIGYLKETWWPKYQKDFDEAGYAARSTASLWLGLDIIETEAGGENDTEGTVTFAAKSLVDGNLHSQREKSLFRKKGDRWYYVKAIG